MLEPTRKGLLILLFLFYKWINQGWENLMNLPKVTQLVNDSARIQIKSKRL